MTTDAKIEAKRALRFMAGMKAVLQMAQRRGGKGVGVAMDVDDTLAMLEAYESGQLDEKLDDPIDPKPVPPFASRGLH